MEQFPRHTCLIYSGRPSQLLPTIGTLLVERLIAGFRCLYTNSPAMVTELRSYLFSAGIDLNRHEERGSLILTSDQSHFVNERFEVEPMISMLRNAAVQSTNDGFTGLWASGDLTWELGREKNVDKLLEYECRLEELFQEVPQLSGICQYHMDSLPDSSIEEALYTHRGVYLNETLCKVNPHFLPGKILRSQRPETSLPRLQEMLENMGLMPYPQKPETALT